MQDRTVPIPERKALEQIYRQNALEYEKILDSFKFRVNDLFRSSSVHLTVKTRVKSFESYYQKLLKRLKEPRSTAGSGRICDLLGMRLVVPFIENIETVKRVLIGHLDIVEQDEKRGEQSFREFGYRSTHFLVRLPAVPDVRFPLSEDSLCEIQVHTLLQDAWAEVEHELVYKAEFTPFDEALKRKLAALNATLTLSDIIFQELRTYQSQLNEQLQRRRTSFLEKLHSEGRDDAKGRTDELDRIDGRHVMDDGLRNDIDQYLLDALYAHNTGDYTRAIELYGRILDLDPPMSIRSIIHVHRGMAFFSCSDNSSALTDLDMALTCDPESCRALNYRGLIQTSRADDNAALHSFDESLRLNPFQYDPLIGRARINCRRRQWEAARQDAERAAGLFPDSAEVNDLLGLIQKETGKTG